MIGITDTIIAGCAAKMYRSNTDFVFTVTRDFVRNSAGRRSSCCLTSAGASLRGWRARISRPMHRSASIREGRPGADPARAAPCARPSPGASADFCRCANPGGSRAAGRPRKSERQEPSGRSLLRRRGSGEIRIKSLMLPDSASQEQRAKEDRGRISNERGHR